MSENMTGEFYAPWRVANRKSQAAIVGGLKYMLIDDCGNLMARAEDDYFLHEAVKRINTHEELLEACRAAEVYFRGSILNTEEAALAAILRAAIAAATREG